MAIGCNAPEPPGSTGGTAQPAGQCGRGAVVISSDYQSTNVGLMRWDGGVLSPSLLSSASKSPALSAPLSGDVVTPTVPAAGDRLVLLDRFPASVLTWVDVRSGAVTGQLSVATGFAANAQDYVEVSPTKAYVTRLDPNLKAGAEPFDGGSDVLVVDPSARRIVRRVDLSPAMAGEDPKFYPRPNRAVLVGGELFVLLSAYALNFIESAPSRVVVIDTARDAIASVVVLKGMHGCSGLAASPSGERLAVACSGTLDSSGASNLAEAGLVVLERKDAGLVEARRWTAAEIGPGTPGFFASFAAEDLVLLTTFGRDATGGAAAIDDTLTAIDLASGEPEAVLRSTRKAFTIGDVRCAAGCGRCLVADAATDGGVVHRFDVDGHKLVHASATRPDPAIGLPPRYLGQF